jgi:signal transduction histidine kinase
VIGTLDVLSPHPAAFSEEDARVVQSLGDQVAVAIQNAWLYDRSRELAVMEERNRLARELHDSVTQSLYSLWLLAEGWRRLATAGRKPPGEEQLSQVSGIAQQALKEMRLLVYELRPAALEQEGLLAALHRRMDAVEKRAGVDARLVADDLVDLPGPVEEALYWIAQEALNNALKHANATSVSLRLSSQPGEVLLEVSDDGSGFDPQAASQSGGLGLASMRERAARMGGTLDVQSAPGRGTTISARLPIPEGQREPIYPVL